MLPVWAEVTHQPLAPKGILSIPAGHFQGDFGSSGVSTGSGLSTGAGSDLQGDPRAVSTSTVGEELGTAGPGLGGVGRLQTGQMQQETSRCLRTPMYKSWHLQIPPGLPESSFTMQTPGPLRVWGRHFDGVICNFPGSLWQRWQPQAVPPLGSIFSHLHWQESGTAERGRCIIPIATAWAAAGEL